MKMQLFKQRISGLIAVGIMAQLCAPVALHATTALAPKPVSYQEVGELYQSSFGIEKPQENNKPKEKIDLSQFNFVVPRVAAHSARQQLFDAFEQSEQLWPQAIDGSFNHEDMMTLVKDLELFRGSGVPSEHLFSHLVSPITLSG